MNVTEIVSTAIATLIVLVLAHLAVYWVVRTLYPPAPAPAPVAIPVSAPAPAPAPQVTFAEPPPVDHVVLPTYEAPAPAEAPRETGERRGPPPAESTSIRGDSRVASPNAQ